MPAYRLIIAPAAKADLAEIYQYGLRQWGLIQSDRYLENLKDRLWPLTEQPLMGVDRPELLPGMRSLTIESHTLFYRITADTVEITRVLSSRQDPYRHLK